MPCFVGHWDVAGIGVSAKDYWPIQHVLLCSSEGTEYINVIGVRNVRVGHIYAGYRSKNVYE